MCVLYLAIESHPRYPLVVAANRDEFFARPSQAAHWWEDAEILGGRDLQAGGTWLGMTRTGRLAIVTNVRRGLESTKKSRGELVRRFLSGDEDASGFAAFLRERYLEYNAFNLLWGDSEASYVFGSLVGKETRLGAGIHSVSNGKPDDKWPKAERGKQRVAAALVDKMEKRELVGALLEILADRSLAADTDLPDTGVGLDLERKLSPIFVSIPETGYGTRSSTVVLRDRDGKVDFVEVNYTSAGVGTFHEIHFDVTDAG